MKLEDRIKHVGSQFSSRLDPSVIAGAVDYVDFGENGLAVEILCEQLIDYEVSITLGEYHQLEQLAIETCVDAGLLEDLRAFVRSASL